MKLQCVFNTAHVIHTKNIFQWLHQRGNGCVYRLLAVSVFEILTCHKLKKCKISNVATKILYPLLEDRDVIYGRPPSGIHSWALPD